jgi:sarcosine oxidase
LPATIPIRGRSTAASASSTTRRPDVAAVADVVVIGLGAFGSAVVHHLAAGGARVIGLDRFHPPHGHGSSHGETRITRLAIGEGDAYVPIVRRSHALWRMLEAETGEALMQRTGGLVIASTASDRLPYHGRSGFFEQTVGAAERFGIAHERLSAEEIRHRFPAFLARGDERGYYEPEAGFLRPERCVAAQLRAAAAHGAALRHGVVVERIDDDGGGRGVRVVLDDGETIDAARAVLATGAWLPAMLPPAQRSRFMVQRQVLHWFATDRPALWEPGRCPVFIWMHGDRGDAFYGFPKADDHPGVKVATEQAEHATTPEEVERTVTAGETSATYERHVRGRLAGVLPRSVHDATCLYTSTADGRFVIGRDPARPALTIVSACSGHGFKHSPAVGEAVADTLLGATPRVDLSPFAPQASGT